MRTRRRITAVRFSGPWNGWTNRARVVITDAPGVDRVDGNGTALHRTSDAVLLGAQVPTTLRRGPVELVPRRVSDHGMPHAVHLAAAVPEHRPGSRSASE